MRVRDCKGERSRWRRSENTPQAWSEAKAVALKSPTRLGRRKVAKAGNLLYIKNWGIELKLIDYTLWGRNS